MSLSEALRRWGLGGGRRRLAEAARGRVLELGIGRGANLPYYRPPLQLVGIDPSPDELAEARIAAAGGAAYDPLPPPVVGVSLVVARAEALPFLDRSFDAVVATLVFCSVEDPPAALAEVRRVLRAHAPLRLVEHIRPARGPLRALIGLVSPLWFRISSECRLDRETPQALRQAGFRIRERRSHLGGALVELVAEDGAAEG